MLPSASHQWSQSALGVGIAFGLYILVAMIPALQVQLYHPGSGIRLQRLTLWSIELSRTWLTKGERISLEMTSTKPLNYPASVAALTAGVSAAAILRAAFIGLLAQKYIQVYHYQSYTRELGSIHPIIQDKYAVAATRQAEQSKIVGELEGRIIKSLIGWSAHKKVIEWPRSLSIYDLVRAVCDSYTYSPEDWLAELVSKDAITQGWGEMTGTRRKRFEWKIIAAEKIRPEYQIIQALTDHLATVHPELSLALDKQIQMVIDSRRRSSGSAMDGV